MTSSLRKRASPSESGNQQRNKTLEACFSRGLDLSELENDFNATIPTTTTTTVLSTTSGTPQLPSTSSSSSSCSASASAQLLPFLQKRAKERFHNDQLELQLHHSIENRARNIILQKHIHNNNSINNMNEDNYNNSLEQNISPADWLTQTLVNMHDKDQHHPSTNARNKKMDKSKSVKHKLKHNKCNHCLGKKRQKVKATFTLPRNRRVS